MYLEFRFYLYYLFSEQEHHVLLVSSLSAVESALKV